MQAPSSLKIKNAGTIPSQRFIVGVRMGNNKEKAKGKKKKAIKASLSRL
jgi:hypothetical protein